MNNVIDHSQSQIGGYVMAQYYPNKKSVQFVVADRGIGFLKNVILKEDVKNESQAIKIALQKGFTATQARMYGSQRNAGYGLYAMKEILDSTNGSFVIISNDMLIRYKNGKFTENKLEDPYKGVIVAFNFIEEEIKLPMIEFCQNVLWKNSEEDELY